MSTRSPIDAPIVASALQLRVGIRGSRRQARSPIVANPARGTGKESSKTNSEGKVTRRRVLRWSAAGGAAGLGATILPAPWRAAFGAAKPYKIGTMQPLSGAAAIIGKTALVGVQMAVDRINKSGGINGRPVELIVADYESKPDVGRRKAEKLVDEDGIDAHVGGVLSNVCLAACRYGR